VDSGLAKILRYDPGAGLDRLELSPISRASAAQRAGRAGRESPGLCVRLWSEHDHRGRPERQTPEIRRVDLTGAVLQLLAWGEPDLEAFPWFEEPNPRTLEDSLRLLELLGAVGNQGVTTLGKTLARFPAPPRIARLLVEGHSHGHPREVARLGALLAERDPFPRRRDRSPAPARSDLWPRLEALERFRDSGHAPETPYGRLRRGPARQVLRASRQLRRILESELDPAPEPDLGMEEALTRSLLAAYPERLGRRREPHSERVVLAGNRGARIGRGSAVRRGELLLALDLAAGRRGEGSEAWIRLATSLEREWLPAHSLEETAETEWDAERERVVGRKRLRFGDLVLEEREVPIEDPERAAEVLIGAAEENLETALGLERDEVRRFLARIRNLSDWRPGLELPRFGKDELRELLPALARGKRSFRELRQAPLVEILSGTLTFEQRKALDQEAPERIEVPTGSRVRLLWTEGEPPVLPVRIQELFGLTETPRVAGGRIPVLLHLLAPNMRPQQITDDLPGFWDRTYPEVRKELAGRYPKHSWPEDPRNARPERK
ncbi:MAG: ATP-dependent helicase C-terminal domain-containing protein, partial [Thermoanaerobaculia bacterium]|nr:ATP-dependent helicase C-terminal domain-containing protein [Thermoanaerobaculia bacterium]